MAVNGKCPECGRSLKVFGEAEDGNCRQCTPRVVEHKQIAGVTDLSRREGVPTLKEKASPVAKKKVSKKKASKKK